ncbi:hypothetical protein ONA00_04325 [Mycoplasmopsis cynos]|uniref:hypothetical protein n=1 Tax=Mycoplasmopsis cynos TaxID=171284 RepID=UPI0024CD14DB|nr:hypothetical protein [Mycoplasmopsis cynos]WAM10573.1 hypothetical protein ONA00_04325 [Mycoplasmopsis cynos]
MENTNNDYIPIFPIVKQFSGDILIKDKLPSELKFVNSQNQFKFYPVSWSVDNDMQIFSDTTINGIVNYEYHDFPVKTYVITQLKSNINESDYFSKEEFELLIWKKVPVTVIAAIYLSLLIVRVIIDLVLLGEITEVNLVKNKIQI